MLNSGEEDGIAIDIQGETKDVRIVANEIRELRQPMNRTGVRIGKEAGSIELQDNRIEGFASAVVDQRT